MSSRTRISLIVELVLRGGKSKEEVEELWESGMSSYVGWYVGGVWEELDDEMGMNKKRRMMVWMEVMSGRYKLSGWEFTFR